ncbi:MAG: hypothetical protein AB8D78_13530 [Akkermansiaceae bacterium]
MKFVILLPLLGLCSCGVTPSPVERQMIGLTEKFDRWDENGDGELSASELSEAEQISGISTERILKFYDTGGDGKISLTEAQEAISRLDEAERLADQ